MGAVEDRNDNDQSECIGSGELGGFGGFGDAGESVSAGDGHCGFCDFSVSSSSLISIAGASWLPVIRNESII